MFYWGSIGAHSCENRIHPAASSVSTSVSCRSLNIFTELPPEDCAAYGTRLHYLKLTPVRVAIFVKHVSARWQVSFQVCAEMVNIETTDDVVVVVLGI